MNPARAATAARVGLKIRKARKRAGLSHDTLATAAGTSRRHLIRLEKGEHLAGEGMLEAIARETGVSVDYLAGESDEEDGESDLARALAREIRCVVRAEMARVA